MNARLELVITLQRWKWDPQHTYRLVYYDCTCWYTAFCIYCCHKANLRQRKQFLNRQKAWQLQHVCIFYYFIWRLLCILFTLVIKKKRYPNNATHVSPLFFIDFDWFPPTTFCKIKCSAQWCLVPKLFFAGDIGDIQCLRVRYLMRDKKERFSNGL